MQIVTPTAFGKGAAAKKPDPLNIGLIGLGEQCQRLVLQAIITRG